MPVMPKISVILPVYNVAPFLRECLDSILAQTFKETEIICVNDGSTDESLQILKEYAGKEPRMVLLDQQNQGAAVARNAGLHAAHGMYVAVLDSDDVYEPKMLEEMYAAAVKNNCDLVVARCDLFDNNLSKRTPAQWSIKNDKFPAKECFSSSEIKSGIFYSVVGWSWDKLLKREFIQRHGLLFQSLPVFNDLYFIFSAFVLAERISIIDRVMVHHRQHKSSISQTRIKEWSSIFTALRALRRTLVIHNLYSRFERDFVNYAVHMPLFVLDKLNKEKQEELKRYIADIWIPEIGFSCYPKSYFSNVKEYEFYINLSKAGISVSRWQRFVCKGKTLYRQILESIHKSQKSA